jgi:hypothetical protein
MILIVEIFDLVNKLFSAEIRAVGLGWLLVPEGQVDSAQDSVFV